MPRTKRPAARKSERAEGKGSQTEKKKELEAKRKIDRWVAEQKRQAKIWIEREVREMQLKFQVLIESIPQSYKQMTIGQLKNELFLNEAMDTQTQQLTRSASHDDGYITEGSAHGSGDRAKKFLAPPSTGGRSTFRRSRSADAASRRAPPSTAHKSRRQSRSLYRTPAYNKNASTLYPVITPKVAPQTPLTVLRQPRLGEMVVSMTGSPVMVTNYSAMQRDEKANCNIELQDGTVLSVKPTQLRTSQAYIPFSLMDAKVLEQLRTLKDNLEKVVNLGEKNIK